MAFLQDLKQWYAIIGLLAIALVVISYLVRYVIARLRIKTWSNDAVAANERGHEAFVRADYEKAISEYNHAIDYDPRFAVAYYNRARAWCEGKQWDRAIADFNESNSLDPQHLDTLQWRGYVFAERGDLQKAIADFDEVLRRDSGRSHLIQRRGVLHHQLGNHDAALVDYNAAIDREPTIASAYWHRSIIHEAQGQLSAAAADLTEALRLEPENERFLQGRGEFYFRHQRVQQAIVDFTTVLRVNPQNANVYNFRGIAWYLQEDYQRAIADYSEAIRLNDKMPEFFSNRGYSRRKLGDLPGAKQDFDCALALDSAHEHALCGRITTWSRLKQPTQAAEDLRQLRTLTKDRGVFYAMRAEAKLILGDIKGAFADLEKRRQLSPENPETHNGLAWRMATFPYDGARYAAEAIRHATEACRLTNHQSIDFLDTLAAAHADAGNFDRAIEHLEQALAIASPIQQSWLESRRQLYLARRPFREDIL